MDYSVELVQAFAIILLSAAAFGLGARKIGLSPIVGYLLAGLLIGNPVFTFMRVTDEQNIQVLSQFGVVFLMFSIGMNFRLKMLRELGFPLAAASCLCALLILNLVRGVATLCGFSPVESLFLGSMLMCSSSAIIGKVIYELNISHERHGQLALGMTLLEDVVAVVMLAFLGAFAAKEPTAGSSQSILLNVLLLVGFALILLICGLLLLPWLLKIVARTKSLELETVWVAGLLFGLAILAFKAGYSLVLGAFLLGMIVAETPRLASLQRAFNGMRDVFSTLFFTSIGMSIEIAAFPEVFGLVLGGTILALAVRCFAVMGSLLAFCEDTRTALRTGLSLTPIGEFSFIIAGMGAGKHLVPESFITAAVGVALLTSIISPLLIQHSGQVADFILRKKLPLLSQGLTVYRNLWTSISRLGRSNSLLQLSKKRLWQIGLEIVIVTALLVFSHLMQAGLLDLLQPTALFTPATLIAFYWTVIVLICLIPLLAIWRNIVALGMILEDFIRTERPHLSRIAPVFGLGARTGGFLFLVLWFWNFLPVGVARGWMLLVLAAIVTGVLAFGWRKLVFLHSHFEVTFENSLQGKAAARQWTMPPWGKSVVHKTWGLALSELEIPDNSVWAGINIADLGLRQKTGCSIIGIERHGYVIHSPGPQSHLFPGDRLLLLGDDKQLKEARKLLAEEAPDVQLEKHSLNSAVLQSLSIPEGSPVIGRKLAELNWPRLYAVQVAGVQRGAQRFPIPGGDFRFLAGDEILAIGTAANLKKLTHALAAEAL